jgi:tripartite ATP-independent transporter DctP family solute receptor
MNKSIIRVFFILLFTLCIGFTAVQANTIQMRIGGDQPAGAPGEKSFSFFAERMKEESDGQIIVTVYPNAVLGDNLELIEQVQAGVLEMSTASMGWLSSFVPLVDVFSTPYLFRDKDHYWKVLDGEVGREIAQQIEEGAGVKLLYWIDAGSRSFYNNVRPIKSPEDLNGLKIRVMGSPIMIQTMEAFGASPTTTSFDEVYSALQTGIIDGAENNPPSIDMMKHNEVSKYFSLDEHMMVPDCCIINIDVWNNLTPEQQEIFIKVSKEAQEFAKEEWARQEEKALEVIRENTEINSIPDKSRFIEAVKPLQQELDKKFDGYIGKIQAVK